MKDSGECETHQSLPKTLRERKERKRDGGEKRDKGGRSKSEDQKY